MNTNPRQLALDILNRIDHSRHTLDQLMDDPAIHALDLSRPDRALFNALVHGVLRWRGHLDWIIRHFSSTPFKKIALPVRNVLRLGLFQIIHLDRVPASAAVNTAVELSKTVAAPWTTRFVNGVLRTAAREYRTVQFPDPATDPTGYLTASKSVPEWLARRWLDRFDLPETILLCDAINRVPPITLRTNTLRTTRENLIAAVSPHSALVEPCRYSPVGIRLEGCISGSITWRGSTPAVSKCRTKRLNSSGTFWRRYRTNMSWMPAPGWVEKQDISLN